MIKVICDNIQKHLDILDAFMKSGCCPFNSNKSVKYKDCKKCIRKNIIWKVETGVFQIIYDSDHELEDFLNIIINSEWCPFRNSSEIECESREYGRTCEECIKNNIICKRK